MANAALRGKPDAGNPHVAPTPGYGGTGRFDEGEVAPTKPRRGSLLYNDKSHTKPKRILSIDVLRGFDMFFIIGGADLICRALVFYHVRNLWGRLAVLSGLVLCYFAILHFGAFPGIPAGVSQYTKEWNVIRWLDVNVYPSHLMIPAVAGTILCVTAWSGGKKLGILALFYLVIDILGLRKWGGLFEEGAVLSDGCLIAS